MSDRKDIDTIVAIINSARASGLGGVDIADAVLAAIGDRLLPELPEGWNWYQIHHPAGSEAWGAILMHEPTRTLYSANGPTLADATSEAIAQGKWEQE